MPIETPVKSRVQRFGRFDVVFARHHVLNDVGVFFVHTFKGKFGKTIGHLVFARCYYLVILRCEGDAAVHRNGQTHGFDFHEKSYFLELLNAEYSLRMGVATRAQSAALVLAKRINQ
tara:strand:- start:1860 stop:2210 length:351 start_codon:yes stop_codon:yes gene_type:complete